MLYAQFYQKAAWSWAEKPIEAIGDRSVIILDARFSLATNVNIAVNECRKRGFVAYAIFRGDNFSRPSATVIPVTKI